MLGGHWVGKTSLMRKINNYPMLSEGKNFIALDHTVKYIKILNRTIRLRLWDYVNLFLLYFR